jgi:Glycosyltransferase family 87
MVSEEQKHQVTPLFATYIILQLSYLSLAALGNWNAHIPIVLAILLVAFVTYLSVVYWTYQNRFTELRFRWILIPALLFRFTVFWNAPTLSEDFYRYVWDGRVQNAGINPYQYPPEAKELERLRNESYAPINHKEFRTPYSAAAESFFHLFAWISSIPLIFKFFIAGFDLLLLELLRRLLIHENRKISWILIYAWHPLPILEFAGSGHMDILGIALLMAAYLLLIKQQHSLSGIAFAGAVLTKYLPVLTFPWFIRRGKWKFLIAGSIIGLLLLLQFYTSDLMMFSGALSYYKKWRFNDSLFGILYKLLGGAEPARVTGMCITALVVAYCLIAKFSFYRSALLAFGTVILFSPVVHPWYLCWILPFLAFHLNRAWLFLTGWILLAYLERYFYPVGVWKPILWLKLLIYVPFYLLLIVDFVLGKRQLHKRAKETSMICR